MLWKRSGRWPDSHSGSRHASASERQCRKSQIRRCSRSGGGSSLSWRSTPRTVAREGGDHLLVVADRMARGRAHRATEPKSASLAARRPLELMASARATGSVGLSQNGCGPCTGSPERLR